VPKARKKVGTIKRKSARTPPRADAKPKAEVSDRRKLKGMVSRDRILDSALELFSQRGYAATGVYDIARAAGIEKTALYWHFGSKEGLLAAVLDRMDAEFVERVSKRVAQSGGDSDDRLDVYVDGLRRLVKERGHLVRLMLSVSIERSQVSDETRAAMLRIFERTRIAVAAGFQQALGVTLPDVDLIARLSLAYLHEASVRAQVDPKGIDLERFFLHLRRLIALDVAHQVESYGLNVAPERRIVRR
jgi:AcrR family transcriptional regulator